MIYKENVAGGETEFPKCKGGEVYTINILTFQSLRGRPHLKGSKFPPRSPKIKPWQLILAKRGRSLMSAVVEFHVTKSTVRDILKNKAKLQTFFRKIQTVTAFKERRTHMHIYIEHMHTNVL